MFKRNTLAIIGKTFSAFSKLGQNSLSSRVQCLRDSPAIVKPAHCDDIFYCMEMNRDLQTLQDSCDGIGSKHCKWVIAFKG